MWQWLHRIATVPISPKCPSISSSSRPSLPLSTSRATHRASRPMPKDDAITCIGRRNTKLRLFGAMLCIGAGIVYVAVRCERVAPTVHAARAHLKALNASNRKRFNFFTAIVEQSKPAVVCIEVRQQHNFNQNELIGSGFIVYADGLILTNAHVVAGRPDGMIVVRLHDGRTFEARIETYDRSADLAMLQINCSDLPTLRLGTSSDLRIGELVMAMGCPQTLASTVTVGVISSVELSARDVGLGEDNKKQFIHTDATLATGSSGGPLINLNGEVIGITSKQRVDSDGFAIPIDLVRTFLDESRLKSGAH